MSWLVRIVLQEGEQGSVGEQLVSYLWDAGTTGVAEVPDETDGSIQIIAGFSDEVAARRAAVLNATSTVEPFIQSNWRGPPSTIIKVDQSTQVTIDAGHSFGHGQHPTTKLVLDQLPSMVKPGSSVLDVGTGSGVLAIVAAKLGAARVLGLDINPDAILAAHRNASANRVQIEIADTPLSLLPAERFDLVVANMLVVNLRSLAHLIQQRVELQLVVSGCLADQGAEVLEMFAPLQEIKRVECDGWVCLVFE